MFDMLKDFVDIFIGGMSLCVCVCVFSGFNLDKVEDILQPNTTSWDRRFNFKFGKFDLCSCCKRTDLPGPERQFFSTVLDKIA